MNKAKLQDRGSACILGVAVGDALGMPVETLWPDEILAATNGAGITGFVAPIQTKVKETRTASPGTTTDDWQLTEVVAKSILEHRGLINPYFCAESHLTAMRQSTFGWGKTTQQAIEAFGRGEYNPATDSLPAALSGKGCGNGIIMKIAPLAIAWSAISGDRNQPLQDQVVKLGKITHPDIRASIAAYPVARMIQFALLGMARNEDEVLERLDLIIEETFLLEQSLGTGDDDQVSDRLQLISGCIHTADTLRTIAGCGFHALETVVFTLGTFMRHPHDFRKGVLEAVNAGGDADTDASIVGALIGANCGLDAIPSEWRSFNPEFEKAVNLGHKLASLT